GRMFFVTFTLDSEKDLGEKPWLEGDLNITSHKNLLKSYGREIEKIADHQYAGILFGNIVKSPRMEIEQIDLSWNIKSIFPEFAEKNSTTKVNGNWNFTFSLPAMDTITQIVTPPTKKNTAFYDKIRKEGVFVEVSSINYTPVSFIIHYSEYVTHETYDEWDFVDTELKVRDDLGNEYMGKHFGGFGNPNRIYSKLKMTQLFNKLDPDASKLFITPIVQLLNADGVDEYGSLYRDFIVPHTKKSSN
ncbi:MAG: DUF5643 domain-containing protein, partial [Caldibacillus sp.]